MAVSGFPSSLDINIDESAKKVTISGRVTDAAGEYAFSVNTVGAATNATNGDLLR